MGGTGFYDWLVVLGLISGFIASKIVNRQGEGLILDIVLGIVGAIVGGYCFSLFGAQGVSGVNIYSMFVAVVGAIVVLVIYHSVTADAPSRSKDAAPKVVPRLIDEEPKRVGGEDRGWPSPRATLNSLGLRYRRRFF